MSLSSALWLFIVTALLLSGASSRACGAEARVVPRMLNPGDAFAVFVRDADGHAPDDARFRGMTIPFSVCGRGCFVGVGAVDLKTRPGSYVVKVNAGRKAFRLRLKVRKMRFDTIRLTLPEDKVSLAPDDRARADAEEARLKRLWQVRSERMWQGGFMMPLGNDLSTGFGVRRLINRKKVSVHGGIDIRGREGEEVVAANRGFVVLSEELFFGGNTVVVDHGSGIYSVYMHLLRPNVAAGDPVETGQVVGFVGSSGRSSGPHLHFGVKVLGTNVDPGSLVRLDLRQEGLPAALNSGLTRRLEIRTNPFGRNASVTVRERPRCASVKRSGQQPFFHQPEREGEQQRRCSCKPEQMRKSGQQRP
ncbi:MAG: hypothetical protein OHK006_07470 [Thermodesulfovibrionales bacterium]